MLADATRSDEWVRVDEPAPAHEPPRLSNYSRTIDRTVDWSYVPGSQQDLHERLVNWGRGLTSRQSQGVSPGFELVKSDYSRAERRSYGGETVVPLSPGDAQVIGMAVAQLAQDEHNDGFRRAKALDWYYRLKCRAAKDMAEEMHYSLHGLADCVIAARYRLIEWGV